MALFPCNVGSGGTTDIQWVGGIYNVISSAYNFKYYDGVTQNKLVSTSGGSSFDNDVTYVSYANMTATYRFNVAGYYLVNNTWKYKAANSTENIPYTEGVLWYSDHAQH